MPIASDSQADGLGEAFGYSPTLKLTLHWNATFSMSIQQLYQVFHHQLELLLSVAKAWPSNRKWCRSHSGYSGQDCYTATTMQMILNSANAALI